MSHEEMPEPELDAPTAALDRSYLDGYLTTLTRCRLLDLAPLQ
jgi:hypothetical protein